MRINEDQVRTLMEELVEGQREKLLQIGQAVIPNLTPDDVLQPVDFPSLEHSASFRYEEGVLEGLMTMRAALLAFFKEKS